MHNYYHEILKKFNTEPIWWTENAFPRWCEFDPHEIDNIYARQTALVEITCQNCGHRFKACFSYHEFDADYDLIYWIKNGGLHYGDPPNIHCCDAGPTMNCDDIRVIEFWQWINLVWERKPEYEIELGKVAEDEKKQTRQSIS